MAEDKAETQAQKTTSMEEKKLPPFDQVPDEKPLPPLKRKVTRLDEEQPVRPAPQPWLFIEGSDEEICGMDPRLVFANLELCTRAVDEFNRQSEILGKRQEEIRLRLKQIGQTAQLLSRYQVRLESMNPKNPNDAVKQFQRRSIEKKMGVVGNIKKVLEGGANLKDLQKALTLGSPLDNSMRRQSGFGNKRPAPMPLKKADV